MSSPLHCIASASAKDVITKTDGTKLDDQVGEITETLIKYRKALNIAGPIYTIALESVASIKHENGDGDTFNTVLSSINPYSQPTSYSDDDLMRLAESFSNNSQSESVSEVQLYNMAYNKSVSYIDLFAKADNYKKIGWIGGSAWLVCGIVASAILSSAIDLSWYWGVTLPIGIGIGTIWCYAFNMKAKSLESTARQMYSIIMMEDKIMQFGQNELTAGIKIMGNRIINPHSI